LAYELRQRGFMVEQQKPLALRYKQVELDCGYRLDLLVEGQLIIELKDCREVAAGP
jgi:GxxExxY protein